MIFFPKRNDKVELQPKVYEVERLRILSEVNRGGWARWLKMPFTLKLSMSDSAINLNVAKPLKYDA